MYNVRFDPQAAGVDCEPRRFRIDVNDLVFRKITLRPTSAEPAINFPVSDRLPRDGLIDAGALVTHTFGFEDPWRILSAAVEGSEPIIKAVMLPHG